MRHLSGSLVVIGLVALGMGFSGRSARAAEKEMEGKIVVMPFKALNESEPQGWAGKSIQQSLLADLTPYAPARVQSSDVLAKDSASALDAGRKQGARYVVIGNFATVGQDLRVTGQVLDVSTGKPLAAMKATGLTRELFLLEDALGSQVRRGLGMTEVAAQLAAPEAGTQAPVMPPEVTAPYGASDFDANPYATNAGYADTGLVYPGWGFAPWIWGLGFGRESHFRHHRNAPTNTIWNGSHALGLANSVDGIPLGPENTPSIAGSSGIGFYPYGSPVYSGANLANSSRLGTVSPPRRTAAVPTRGGNRAAPSRSASAPRH